MIKKKIEDLAEVRKTINVSSSKNNKFLIFFTIFILYILISVLGTSDLMLLLPEHVFKMPLINFDLDLISFYILAPVMLLLLHFNIMFNYNMYLKKIDIHNNKINMETIDPSIYAYAYTLLNHGFGGLLINLFLWIWIYLSPLIVLIFIYLRFADYHHQWITLFHLLIVLIDIILIFLSFHYNNIHLKYAQTSIRMSSAVFRFLLLGLVILGISHYYFFFTPVVQKRPDPRIKLILGKEYCDTDLSQLYHFIVKDKNTTMPTNCFPRLVVNEAEMAKISSGALYIPRYLAVNKSIDQPEKEKQLILEYGARSDLAHRNLRYAKLYGSILTRTDLSHSDLQYSDLRKSHLQAAKLIDTKLQGACLMGARLDNTELEGANLTGANLSALVSKNGHFPSAILIGSKMLALELKKADFYEANLTEANLGNSNLPYSYFYKADLTDANLTGSDLSKSELIKSNFTESNLSEVAFYAAKLNDSNFSRADFTTASLRGSNLSNTDFTESILISVDFSNTYVDRKKNNVSLQTILNQAKEAGGIIIDNNITNKKKNKVYFTDTGLTDCEKYLTIVLDSSDAKLKVTKRRIKYLIKGIQKYTNHEGEPLSKCPEVDSPKLTNTLQKILTRTCKHLKDFLDRSPQYTTQYEDTIYDCQKNTLNI